MKTDASMDTDMKEIVADGQAAGSDDVESLLRSHSILPTIIQLFLKSQQLQQQSQQTAPTSAASAGSNDASKHSSSLLTSPALGCSSLLSGMALFLQLVDSNAKVKTSKARAVAPLHPLHSLLPLFYSLSSPMLLPLLRYDDEHIQQQYIPVPTTASTQQSFTAKQLTIRFLSHLTQHEHVCASIAQSTDSASLVQFLMSHLKFVTSSSDPSASHQPSEVEDVIVVLDRITAILKPTSSDNSSSVIVPSLSLPLLQPLVDTVSNAALPQKLSIAAARILSALLPNASVSTQPLLFSRFIPSLAASVDRDHGALKFAALEALLACYSLNDHLSEQGKGLEDSHEMGTIARRKHAADFPLYALQIRQALQVVMGSKLDTEKRFVAIKLSRCMLERYGPMWASVPTEMSSTSTANAKASTSSSKSASPSSSSSSSPLPHLTFLQVWSNVFSVELRLGLYELTASDEIRSDRGMTQEKQQQFVIEALRCFRMLLQFLLGGEEEEDDEDEDQNSNSKPSNVSNIKKVVASFQWWNLPMSLLMHFKKQLEECINSLLEYLSDLQSIMVRSSVSTGVNSLSDSELRILYSASLAIVDWITEESEAMQMHQEAICAVLPFLIQLPRLPDRVSVPIPGNGTILGALLNPMHLQLVHDSKAAAVLLRERVPMQLIERVVVPLYNDEIKKQLEFLGQLAWSSDSRAPVTARSGASSHEHDTSDLHAVILSHLRRHILTICTACDVIHVLCGRKGVDAKETKQEVRIRRSQLQPILEACLDIALQKLLPQKHMSTASRPAHAEEQDEILKDGLASIQELLEDF